MITVEVKLFPYGRGSGEEIATMRIVNDASGNEAYGNYDIDLEMRGRKQHVKIRGFRRNQGILALLQAAIDESSFRLQEDCLPL